MSDSSDAGGKLNEAAIQARARLAAYEKVVRQAEGGCPPIFNLTGLDLLFAGRRLEDLVRRPFAGRCAVREKGKDT